MNPATHVLRALQAACLLLALAAGAAAQVDEAQDLVVTKGGKEHRGQVVYETKEILVLRSNTKLTSFKQEKLREVQAVLRELPVALDKLRKLKPDDLEGQLGLAAEMLASNLQHEARLVYWRVLTLDAQNATAHTALQHRLVDDEWQVRAGSGWLKLRDLLQHHEDWNEAWEFETTHFALRSNLPLRDVLRAAFDLEFTYVQFHRLFGEAFELHESKLKIGAWIHADEKSYSDPNQGRGGYYNERERRLYVDATQPDWRNTVIHEGTHGIIDFAAAHTKSGSGHIPGWLHESLALHMQPHKPDGSYSDEPMDIGTSAPITWLLKVHASAKKPFSIKHVLSMAWEDFALIERGDLRYAQAYSLAHFCLHADGGKHREKFYKFVRGAFQGKASSTDFRKALGMQEKALEKAIAAFITGF